MHRVELTAHPAYELTVTERLTLMPTGFRLTVGPRSQPSTPVQAPEAGGSL